MRCELEEILEEYKKSLESDLSYGGQKNKSGQKLHKEFMNL